MADNSVSTLHEKQTMHITTSNFPQPIPATRLKQICNDACSSALSTSTTYDHAQTQAWNSKIINDILKALISESTSSEQPQSKYKFAVNSTIIQHLSDPSQTTEEDDEAETKDVEEKEAGVTTAPGASKKVGRRGMHSASGAYWNNERDGMWSHKYEGGEDKGMDIVISIMWIGV